jgi:FemAB-related protein (PEP-CTERM system-associated)
MSVHTLVSVVVPIGNPEAQPQKVVTALYEALTQGGYAVEFVLVLDGPVGPVERQIESMQCSCPIKIVRLQGGGLGESIALSAGVARAEGIYIVNVPPYLQTEPEDVLKVVAALEAGADCVATWRTPRVDPWLNQLQSRLFNFMLRVVMGMPYHDLNSGTRGFRKQVLEEVSVYGELYRFLPVLALRQGFRVVEVKVRHREERGRAGFYGVGVYLRRLLDILAISFLTRFTQQPLRFFGYVGFLGMVLGVALAAQPIYAKLFLGVGLADRPLFVIGAILAAFGVQLIGFGLIGEIIIFTQAPNLRDYKVEEVIEGGAEVVSTHGEGSRGPSDPIAAVVDLLPVTATKGAPEPLPLPLPEHEGALPPPPRPAAIAINPAASATATSEGPPREMENGAAASPVDLTTMRVRELLPGEDSRWDAFVTRHPHGSFFHLSGWRRCTTEVFHHEPHYLIVEQGRRWIGVLPLFLVKSPFLGRNLISVPYGVYGGALAESLHAQQALLDYAAELGRRLAAGYVELRHLEERPGVRTNSQLYVTFRCNLPDDPAKVLPAIPKKARAEVRRARRPQGGEEVGHGLSVQSDCDLDMFFDLFAENKQRLGSPALPKRWFAALCEEFGRKVVFHRVVDPQGKTLAAVMSFLFRDTVNAYYSGSLTGINDTGANNLIYCGIMEWAVEEGFTRFDFGRSRLESGPAHFKKNMGFVSEPLRYEYILVGDGAKPPDFHPGNPKLDLPRRMWSKMPTMFANRLGARLSRYLP